MTLRRGRHDVRGRAGRTPFFGLAVVVGVAAMLSAAAPEGRAEEEQPKADLALVSADSPDPLEVGSELTYTVDVSNAGPRRADDVVVAITLPAGALFRSGSGCSEAIGVVTCPFGSLQAGSQAQVQVVVEPTEAGQLTSVVTVSAATSDPDPGNNSASTDTAVVPARPNIVVVMADDHPALDGRLIDLMPTVKSLFVDAGVTFSDFHSETPLCCPARAGFLTGQHTHNHGVVANQARDFTPTMSVATQLAAVGYHTVIAGKYMNGYGKPSCNNPANCAPTIPPGWAKWVAFSEPDYYEYDLWIGDGGAPATKVHYGSTPAEYSTDVIAQKAVEMIQSAPSDQPLFAWIATNAPHYPGKAAPRHKSAPCPIQPWAPPSWNEADVSDKPQYVQELPLLKKPAQLKKTCRALMAVDELVDQVRDALAASGRLDDTLFIYSGDNGMQGGEHRLTAKSAPYQTQIPFYVSWPEVLGTAPRAIAERVQNIDFAPTACELAGCTLGPFPNGQSAPDGVSLVDLLLGAASSLGRDAVLDEMPQGWRLPDWYAVTTTAQSPLASSGCSGASLGLCRWHYVEYPETGERELYDVSNSPCWTWTADQAGDPCELVNVVSDSAYAQIVSDLDARLESLVAEPEDP